MKINVKNTLKLNNDGLIVLISTLLLSIIGVFMIYSSSNIWANFLYNDEFYYYKRQLIFFILGLFVIYIFYKIDINFLYKYINLFELVGIILLILVLIPGIGIVKNGSQSWFGIGNLSFQPAELFKILSILYVSKHLGDNYKNNKKIKDLLLSLIMPLLGFLLILIQPDFGSGIVMISAIVIMSMMSKVKFKNFIYLGLLGVGAIVVMIISEPYRIDRIIAYIDPFSDPLGSGFQIIQSLYALGPGGILGSGVNNSIQKHFYLPEPQTDFIFAIIAEEYGLIGSLLIIILFGLLFYFGFSISKKQNEYKLSLLSIGIVSLIGVQVVINLGVVVGLLPVTGITLPFISYGGSSLLILDIGIGILLNLSKEKIDESISC